ncbi:MAG: glycosyltransferase family 4 protein [Actinomycetota bacterium]|nr:glycosyltransferase family 4 protein [Actinomycetota bacterium]
MSADLYGSTRSLLNALPELAASFRLTVVFPNRGPAVEEAEACGASVLVLPDFALRRRYARARAFPAWLGSFITSFRRLRRLHRSHPFDLVYSNTLAVALGPLLAVMLRIPHILHMRECPRTPPWAPKVLLRMARLSSDLVICNSNSTRAFLIQYEPEIEPKSVVIYNGIEIPSSLPNSPAVDALRVCCVARIHPTKGHAVLFEAAHLARNASSRWELHLYGDILPEHESLRAELLAKIREYGLEGWVHWHGFVDDTAAVYRDADVCVVPSVVPEAFSLVCVEAQSRCLPVVATAPGGPAEIIIDGESGYLVPPEDPAALADAVRRLERDPALRQRMGERGRQRMLAHFSREVYAAKVRAACEQVTALSGRRSGTT